MGAYASSISLAGHASSEKAVQRTFAATLASAWEDLLSPLRAWARLAGGWVSTPFDALLEIQVNGSQVIFWFNDSVRWSSALAEHWLDIALAARRRSFEVALDKLGLRLGRDWPDLERARGSRRLFFATDDGRIGRAPDDGEDVAWEVAEYGDSYEAPSSPPDELGPVAREALDRARRTGRCGCPLCEKVFPENVVNAFEPVEGFSTRLEGVLGPDFILKVARAGDHWLVVIRLEGRDVWTFRTPNLGAPGPTIEPLSGRNSAVDHFAIFGESIVAQVGLVSRARLFSRSLDGGATWSERSPVIGLPALKSAAFFDGGAPGVVFAAGGPVNELYRSIDGGATFEVVAAAPTLDAKPIRGVAALAECGGALFALLDTKKKTPTLATSSDGGATFRSIPVPAPFAPRSITVWPGDKPVIGCVVGQHDPRTSGWRSAAFIRSTDAGESWSTHPISSLGAARVAAVPSGLLVSLDRLKAGVLFSPDQGVTWTKCASNYPPGMFADPTGERLGIFTIQGAIYSVSRLL